MSSEKEDKGRKAAKKIAGFSENLLNGIKTIAEHAGADTTAVDEKIGKIQLTASQIDEVEPPKKLDWTVAVGFVIFMIAMIGAVFGQNIRWLGIAFMIMPIVIGFGLANNVINMQPDWEHMADGSENEIQVPGAPQSLKSASGSSSNKPQTKRAYWRMIVLFSLGGLLFFGLGVFITFSEFAAG